jgi:hypothetical protein
MENPENTGPLKPHEIAGMDQNNQLIVDTYPAFWWGLYKGCREQGFTDSQAFALVQTWVVGIMASMRK